jgi:hypothetical protein
MYMHSFHTKLYNKSSLGLLLYGILTISWCVLMWKRFKATKSVTNYTNIDSALPADLGQLTLKK